MIDWMTSRGLLVSVIGEANGAVCFMCLMMATYTAAQQAVERGGRHVNLVQRDFYIFTQFLTDFLALWGIKQTSFLCSCSFLHHCYYLVPVHRSVASRVLFCP